MNHQQMYSKNQNFLYETPSVLNLESFNLDQHLDMNRYSCDFGNGEQNNNEVSLLYFLQIFITVLLQKIKSIFI
jgi:hypothetical protein